MPASCLIAVLTVFLCSCATPKGPESVWPPRDFYLEVSAGENSAAGQQVRQSLRVYADGFLVYREAVPPGLRSSVEGAPILPVFEKVCAYRLAPQSVRMLARLLYRDNIQKIPSTVGLPGGASGLWLQLRCRAFERDKRIHARGRVYGPLNRILHTVNAFLPESAAFTLPEMTDQKEPRHVVDLQPVRHSLAGSLVFHKKLVDRFPEDLRYAWDLFALAVRAGDVPEAKRMHTALTRALRAPTGEATLFPELKTPNVAAHLDALLVQLKPAPGSPQQ